MRMKPGLAKVISSAVAAVAVLALSSCGGGNAGKDEPTTTTTDAPRTKNAALNGSINTPGGSVRPGSTAPAGITIRPVRTP